MKNKIIMANMLFAALASFFVVLGCEESGGWTPVPDFPLKNSYVNFYYKVADVDVWELSAKDVGQEQALSLVFFGKLCNEVETKNISDALGDTLYTYENPDYRMPDAVLTDSVLSIDITCSPAYDSEHKSGSSLADIVLLCRRSYYDFVRGGYAVDGYESKIPEDEALREYVKMIDGNRHEPGLEDNPWVTFSADKLADVSFSNTKMMSKAHSFLWFAKKPDNPGRYNLVVSIRMSSGLEKNIPLNVTF